MSGVSVFPSVAPRSVDPAKLKAIAAFVTSQRALGADAAKIQALVVSGFGFQDSRAAQVAIEEAEKFSKLTKAPASLSEEWTAPKKTPGTSLVSDSAFGVGVNTGGSLVRITRDTPGTGGNPKLVPGVTQDARAEEPAFVSAPGVGITSGQTATVPQAKEAAFFLATSQGAATTGQGLEPGTPGYEEAVALERQQVMQGIQDSVPFPSRPVAPGVTTVKQNTPGTFESLKTLAIPAALIAGAFLLFGKR